MLSSYDTEYTAFYLFTKHFLIFEIKFTFTKKYLENNTIQINYVYM
jgi:hypothetical protein